MGSQQVSVELYNMKDVPIQIPTGTPIACMVVVNIILETILVDSLEAEEKTIMTIEER